MWNKYLEKVSELVGKSSFGLQEGASMVDFMECENIINIPIPDDLKDIYKLNNGQKVDNFPVFPEAHEFLPLSDVCLVWNQLNEAGSGEDGFLWKPYWIPFAQTIGGGVLCYAVGRDETKIVQFYPDSDKEEVYADSLDSFIESLIVGLENKELTFDKNNNSFSFC